MSGTAEGPAESGDARSPYALADDDPRFGPPNRVTETPVDPQLALLPTHGREWSDFERLLLRVGREVQGLRPVRLFGNPGQAQYGLDAIGLNAQNEIEAIQGKRYASFDVSDLDAAVTMFVDGPMAAEVQRLAIGVSSRANEREVSTRLVRLNRDHAPTEFELWDRAVPRSLGGQQRRTLRAFAYRASGDRSAEFGHAMVPASASTRTAAKVA